MKKSIWLALLAMLFLFANSCHDEIVQESDLTLKSGKLKKDVVAEMKKWFDSNPGVNKFVLTNYLDEIQWSSAQVMELDNSIITEVKVKLKEKYKVISEKDASLNFDFRLLFIKNGEIITSYMEYLFSGRDLVYLQDTEKASYLKRDGSFEGTIVLENSKGELSTIYHSNGDSQELRLKNVVRICWELVERFDDGSYQVLAFLGCTGVDESGGGPPTGGGGGNNTPPTTTNTPKLDQISNICFLVGSQRTKAETALNNLINEGCFTSSVYNFLVSCRVKLDFKMNSSLEDPASYGPASKSISFRGDADITSANLKEELFHAMQDAYYPGGIAQYVSTTGKVQIEFEAKLYKDIDLEYGCCYIFQDPSIPYEIRNGYTMWVESIRDTRNISNDDYQNWLGYFNQYHPRYNSSISSNLTSPSVLHSVISQCPN
jgi:hypothetical protein